MIRISALQMQTAGTDTAANLARIEKAARQAAEAGATLLVTPRTLRDQLWWRQGCS